MEIEIQGLSLRGFGTAPLSSRETVEVATALPGERVRIELKASKQREKKGRLLEILRASPERVEPRCKHAHLCGGCSLQHLAYPSQLVLKERRVREAFAGLVSEVRPIVGMENPWRYRNKMEFTFSENRGGTRYLGLMIAQAEPYVFNLEECHLASPWFAECVAQVRAWWEATQLPAYHPKHDRGLLRYVTLRESVRTGQRMAILNISGEPFPEEHVDSLKRAVGPEVALFLRAHKARKGTPTEFVERHLGGPSHIVEELFVPHRLAFKISPASFFQPNTVQAERLYQTAMDLITPRGVVYDLYCGTGTLGMIAAHFAKQVIGIELSEDAVCDARENALRNGISNIRFECGDVGKTLSRLEREGIPRPDCVIVDPPRAGLDSLALAHLQALAPREMLYISCNPLTQAENIRVLMASGYRIVALQPFDQFPHTYHIENIALLRAS